MANILPINYPSPNTHMFTCENCHFTTYNKKDYTRHLTTRKHERLINTNNPNPNTSKSTFQCVCGKEYKHEPSLYKHKKQCQYNVKNTAIPIDHASLTEKMIELVMSKNQEFMNMFVEKMMEMMPQIGNNSHNNTNSNNTNNNQFNIQMFLNEHCKNAMNLTEFIESLPITATTFDSTIENGLTKTVTNMITNGLSKLDILERPIHCTDAARKTLYVKEANVWEKDIDLKKIVAGITNLIVKKRDLICEWKEANRGWDTIESKQIRFTELVCNIMTDVERDEKETGKIIRAISKTVYLDNEEKKKYLC